MPAPILFVPGLRDHVAEHWQTLLSYELEGSRTVPPLEQDKLSLAARMAAIDRAVDAFEEPPILVAHSAGVLMVAHWAQHFSRPIKGALLATPPDISRPLPEGYPKPDQLQAGGWLPVPRQVLPFPSVLVASDDDPLASPGSVADLALAWGARLVMAGPVGHLNPAAGYGPWPMAKKLIAQLDSIVSA